MRECKTQRDNDGKQNPDEQFILERVSSCDQWYWGLETFVKLAGILNYIGHKLLSPPLKPHGVADAHRGLMSLEHGSFTVTLCARSSWKSTQCVQYCFMSKGHYAALNLNAFYPRWSVHSIQCNWKVRWPWVLNALQFKETSANGETFFINFTKHAWQIENALQRLTTLQNTYNMTWGVSRRQWKVMDTAEALQSTNSSNQTKQFVNLSWEKDWVSIFFSNELTSAL